MVGGSTERQLVVSGYADLSRTIIAHRFAFTPSLPPPSWLLLPSTEVGVRVRAGRVDYLVYAQTAA